MIHSRPSFIIAITIRGSHHGAAMSAKGSLFIWRLLRRRTFIKAREARKHAALTPEGARVGFAGGKDYQDHTAIWKVLDNACQRHPDMVLVHGGALGAELIAGKWANARGVSQIVCKPDWANHNNVAPFKRNDEMLNLGLIGLIAALGSGITDNLVDKACAQNVQSGQSAK